MADIEDDAVVEKEGEDEKQRKRIGFLPAVVIQILKLVGLGILAILLIVSIVIVTLKVMNVNTQSSIVIPASDAYIIQNTDYSWFTTIEPLRGSTNDVVKKTFIIKVNIGYTLDDAATNNELLLKSIPITDVLLSWFASKSASYLNDFDNRNNIRDAIIDEINNVLSRPIQDVRFTQYQVLD